MEMPGKKMPYGSTGYGKKTASYAKKKPTAKESTKTRTSGDDPAAKKTGATKETMGSTYDYRKGSTAKKPVDSKKQKREQARLAKKRANAIKRAAKKKARTEKRAAKKTARAKKRGLK